MGRRPRLVAEPVAVFVGIRRWLQARLANDRRSRLKNPARSLALFTRQLAVLLSVGVQVVPALDSLAFQSDQEILRETLIQVSRDVQNGQRFSLALSRHPQVFSPLFTPLVGVGEQTGGLVVVMLHLADHLEKEAALGQKVRSALSYPLFVTGLAMLLAVILFRTVLPSFAEFFHNFSLPLPLPTRLILGLTDLAGRPLFWLVLVVLGWLVQRGLTRSLQEPDQKLALYRLVLGLPGFGPLLKVSSLARYCWVMQLTLESGVDLRRALLLSARASGSPTLEDDSQRASDSLREGELLSDHMLNERELYPNLLRQMVLLGEEATSMGKVLGHCGHWFEEEASYRISVLQAAVEPILLMSVSTLVAGVVLSVFLPLYACLDKLGGGS